MERVADNKELIVVRIPVQYVKYMYNFKVTG